MRKLSTRAVWFITVLLLLIGVGLIVWTANSTGTLTTVLVVLVAIDFILLTMFIQVASFKTFKYKPKLVDYPKKSYQSDATFYDILKKANYKERKCSYGSSFLKIEGKKAYKIVLVDNNDAYYNPVDEDNYEPDKRLDKCDSFVAFEIFLNLDEETKKKLPDYSIQGENVYYTALGKEDNIYTCYNYIEPNLKYEASVNKVLELLELKDLQDETTKEETNKENTIKETTKEEN